MGKSIQEVLDQHFKCYDHTAGLFMVCSKCSGSIVDLECPGRAQHINIIEDQTTNRGQDVLDEKNHFGSPCFLYLLLIFTIGISLRQ